MINAAVGTAGVAMWLVESVWLKGEPPENGKEKGAESKGSVISDR